MMKILLLAGGYGTRLAEVAKDKPKALLPINGRPLVEFIIDRLKDCRGLDEILLVTNDKFYNQFKEWAAQIDVGKKLTIVNDGTKTPEERLGSVGDISFVIQKQRIVDDLLIVGSDNLFNFNVKQYISFSQKNTDAVTIGLYDIGAREEASKFGVVQVNKEGKVLDFQEKPENPPSSLVAMCFYYMPKKSLGLVKEYLLESGKSDRAGDYIKWLHEKYSVFGFNFEGKWYDIGSIESYNEAKANFV